MGKEAIGSNEQPFGVKHFRNAKKLHLKKAIIESQKKLKSMIFEGFVRVKNMKIK